MENLVDLLDQARKIDEGVASLSSRWHNPTSIGLGTNAEIRVNNLNRILDEHEEFLHKLISSLERKICAKKKSINQKEETLNQIISEIKKIEDVGMNCGFSILSDIETGKFRQSDHL